MLCCTPPAGRLNLTRDDSRRCVVAGHSLNPPFARPRGVGSWRSSASAQMAAVRNSSEHQFVTGAAQAGLGFCGPDCPMLCRAIQSGVPQTPRARRERSAHTVYAPASERRTNPAVRDDSGRHRHICAFFHSPVVCAYGLSRFRADVVVDVIRTHPLIIIAGHPPGKPLFVPPDEFLGELRARRSR